jgi:hypothetical protein
MTPNMIAGTNANPAIKIKYNFPIFDDSIFSAISEMIRIELKIGTAIKVNSVARYSLLAQNIENIIASTISISL